MQGSFYGEIQMSGEYESVAAYAVDSRAGSGSGEEGSYWQGFRIDWTTNDSPGGITNSGWYINDVNSPFYEKTEEEIINYANTNGNLNIYFSQWVNKEGIDRDRFIRQTLSSSCWSIM